ncbi:hypothetical protein KQI84_18995 [bacterium]|nr:hypothetical protein [bacterium]
MPTFFLLCRDAKDSREKRPHVRPAHLEYWKPLDEAGRIVLAGPLTDFAGSMFVLEAESAEEIERLANGDPYFREGVFESMEIHPFKCVLPAEQYGQG